MQTGAGDAWCFFLDNLIVGHMQVNPPFVSLVVSLLVGLLVSAFCLSSCLPPVGGTRCHQGLMASWWFRSGRACVVHVFNAPGIHILSEKVLGSLGMQADATNLRPGTTSPGHSGCCELEEAFTMKPGGVITQLRQPSRSKLLLELPCNPDQLV